MTDYFALLEEPRRPWLDADALKEKFLALSTTVHPDRVHNLGAPQRDAAGQRYSELNAAYHCLRDPKTRLRHLLTLELGAMPTDIQQIPPELMNQFMEVGQLCKRADNLLSEKSAMTSPLLKVQYFERSQHETESLLELQKRLTAKRDALIESVKQIGADWATPLPGREQREILLVKLAELQRLFSYFDRWLGQVQERIARLSF